MKATTTASTAEQDKKELLELVETLKEELNETTNRLEVAEKDLDAMKTQSEGLHREYDRVLDINNRLEKKMSELSEVDGGANDEKKDN